MKNLEGKLSCSLLCSVIVSTQLQQPYLCWWRKRSKEAWLLPKTATDLQVTWTCFAYIFLFEKQSSRSKKNWSPSFVVVVVVLINLTLNTKRDIINKTSLTDRLGYESSLRPLLLQHVLIVALLRMGCNAGAGPEVPHLWADTKASKFCFHSILSPQPVD